MEIEKIITELYSLRAGLSLIAKEKEMYDEAANAAEKRKKDEIAIARAAADSQIAQSAARKQQTIDLYRAAYEKYSKAEEEYSHYRSRAKHEETDMEHGRELQRKNKQLVALEILLPLLHIILAGLSCIDLYVFGFNGFFYIPIAVVSLGLGISHMILLKSELDERFSDPDSSVDLCILAWQFLAYLANLSLFIVIMVFRFNSKIVPLGVVVGMVISSVLCALLTFLTMNWFCDKNRSKIQSYERELTDTKKAAALEPKKGRERDEAFREWKQLSNYDSLKDALNRLDLKHQSEKREIEKEYEAACKRIEAQNQLYELECAAKAAMHAKVGAEMWEILVKSYGSLLDVRDWKILDLVIWQLETGRAESLKEALQLADRETQTDRIMQTFQTASQAIVQKMQIGFGSLQTQLNHNFSMLSSDFSQAARRISSQIDKNSEAIGAYQESQASKIVELTKGLEEIVTQSSLQSALIEKANLSSKSLIDAVEGLRKAQKA